MVLKLRLSLAVSGVLLASCKSGPQPAGQMSSEELHRVMAFEKADPDATEIYAAYNAGAPLAPEVVIAKLVKSCGGGNRYSCLSLHINQVQRGADPKAFAAYAYQVFLPRGEARLAGDTALNAYGCLHPQEAEKSWAYCQALKAEFLTVNRAMAVSGESFVNLFPKTPMPATFPLQRLDQLVLDLPGRGWHCFMWGGKTEAKDRVMVKDRGQDCSRTALACEQVRLQAEASSTATITVRAQPCESRSNKLLHFVFWQAEGKVKHKFYADPEDCESMRSSLESGGTKPSMCVAVGDVTNTGL